MAASAAGAGLTLQAAGGEPTLRAVGVGGAEPTLHAASGGGAESAPRVVSAENAELALRAGGTEPTLRIQPTARSHNINLWGRGFHRQLEFDDRSLDYDGQVRGLIAGIDSRINNRVFGLGLMASRAELDFSSTATGLSGNHETNTVNIHPYAGLQLGDGTLLWGSVGLGKGEVVVRYGEAETAAGVDQSNARRHADDYSMQSLILGGYRPLARRSFADRSDREARRGNTSLGLIADVMFTRLTEDSTDGTTANAGRIRLGLKLADQTITGNNLFRGMVNMAYRGDFGDVSTDHGLELGGGLNFTLNNGLLLTATGRTLLLHDDGRDWGLAASVNWRATQTGQGLSLSFAPSWGTDGGGFGGGFGHNQRAGYSAGSGTGNNYGRGSYGGGSNIGGGYGASSNMGSGSSSYGFGNIGGGSYGAASHSSNHGTAGANYALELNYGWTVHNLQIPDLLNTFGLTDLHQIFGLTPGPSRPNRLLQLYARANYNHLTQNLTLGAKLFGPHTNLNVYARHHTSQGYQYLTLGTDLALGPYLSAGYETRLTSSSRPDSTIALTPVLTPRPFLSAEAPALPPRPPDPSQLPDPTHLPRTSPAAPPGPSQRPPQPLLPPLPTPLAVARTLPALQ